MAISDLTAVVPPSAGRDQSEVDWNAVEQRIGLPLPQDYKDAIARYGVGSFDDFLYVCLPVTDIKNLDLAYRQQVDLDTLRTLQDDFHEDVPYRVADPAELLPAAVTTSGDTVYWHVTDPKEPDSWTIAVNEARSPEWFRYDGGLTAFLAAVLARRVQVVIFGDDIPHQPPEFLPYDV